MNPRNFNLFHALAPYERAASYVSIVALAALAILSSSWSIGNTVTTTQVASPAPAFWRALTIMGAEVEHYGTLAEMASSSTAVVRGRFTDFALSRQIRGDAAEDIVSYGVATLAVKEIVRGQKLDETIPVEFLLPDTAVATETVVASMKQSMPKGELLLFLRRKRGRSEAQFFRVVNSKGLWIGTASGVQTPLARPHQGAEWHAAYQDDSAGEHRYASELVGVRSVSDLADSLRR